MISVTKREFNPASVVQFINKGINPIIAKLFSSRGVSEDKDALLHLKDLIPLSELTNADKMAEVLANAIMRKDKILVVADYDADGATSCAICVRALKAFGANVEYLIPNRLEHGYGLTPDIVEVAKETHDPKYLLTVDNGIASHAGVDKANELGIKVLVTDHHLPAETHPDAEVIVNPNQHGCNFPSKALAGCGVAYYVMWALQLELERRGVTFEDNTFKVVSLLPLVAVGTVADLVALDVNNRILVKNGLEMIRKKFTFPGIEQLCLVAERVPRNITTTDIGFQVGPRINAAGRLDTMDIGVECLITDSVARARHIAKVLNEINKDRKLIERDIVDDAVHQIAEMASAMPADRMSVALYNKDWHEGVIGIAASRVKDLKFRPTFILTSNKHGQVKGSGRSIPGVHLRDALVLVDRRNPGLMIKYGGHAMAAGITIRGDGFELFRDEFEKVCAELIKPEMLEVTIQTDGGIEDFDLDIQNVRMIKNQVWGQAFTEPAFQDTFEVLKARVSSGVLMMDLKPEGKPPVTALRYKFDGVPPVVGSKISCVFLLDAKTYKDKENINLIISHFIEP